MGRGITPHDTKSSGRTPTCFCLYVPVLDVRINSTHWRVDWLIASSSLPMLNGAIRWHVELVLPQTLLRKRF